MSRALCVVMRRSLVAWLAPIGLVACGAATEPQVASPSPSPNRSPVPPPVVRGIHGHAITELVATADGGAALTIDAAGQARLWPRLDGTLEPVAIEAPPAHALALARDVHGDLALALADTAGYLIVRHHGADGAARATVHTDPIVVTAVAATPRGFVALTDDRALAIVDRDGHVRARLTPEPGTRIVAVRATTTTPRVLALADDLHAHGRARWIDLDTDAWAGPSTDLGAAHELARAVLAPDDAHLIAPARAGAPGGHAIAIATGAVAARLACAGAPAGFVDATTLACLDERDALSFWRDGVLVPGSATPVRVEPHAFAVGRGVAIAAFQTQLVLAAPSGTRYLGYDRAEIPAVHADAAGLVIGIGDATLARLDRALAPIATAALPDGRWLDAAPLDAAHVLALVADAHDARALAIVRTTGAGAPAIVARVAVGARTGAVRYAPSTGLVDCGDDRGAVVRRVDRAHLTFGPPIALASAPPLFVDPARAGGAEVLVLEPTSRPPGAIVHALALDTGAPRELAHHAVVGAFVASDEAGGVYTSVGSTDAADLVLWRGGEQVATLAGVMPALVRPDPTGARIVVARATVLSLYRADGARAWIQPALPTTDLGWVDGALIATFATGVARVDVDTGELAERRCGWRFGLYEMPRTSERDEGVVCD